MGVRFRWVSGYGTNRRDCSAVVIESCESVRIENVCIHHAWGMGFLAQDCTDVTISGCRVAPSGSRRFSLTADASHFVNCRGRVLLQDNHFQNQFDDALNLHGTYWQAVHQPTPRQLALRYGHYHHRALPALRPGDPLRIRAADSLTSIAEARVLTATASNSACWQLTVDEDLPAIPPGSLIENIACNPALEVRGNTFRWNRARSMLINTAGPVGIHDNHIESTGCGIAWEAINGFMESGGLGRASICDNHFVGCGRTPAWGSACIHVAHADTPAGPVVMGTERTLELRGNRFTDCSANTLEAPAVVRVLSSETGA